MSTETTQDLNQKNQLHFLELQEIQLFVTAGKVEMTYIQRIRYSRTC